jgi:hypothetical protein
MIALLRLNELKLFRYVYWPRNDDAQIYQLAR